MKEPKKITRQEANKIIADKDQPYVKHAVGCFQGQWYDFRELNEAEFRQYALKLTETEEFKEADIDIDFKKGTVTTRFNNKDCDCRGNMNINNPKEPFCPSCGGNNPSYHA